MAADEKSREYTGWRYEPGKRVVFKVGFGLQCMAFFCFFVAFVSPDWIVSWERVHSGIKQIGLWEVCFAGLVLDTDRTQKSYHGCWWILSSEFTDIRSWLFPPWFVATQIACAVSMVLHLLDFILMGVLWLTSEGKSGRSSTRFDPLIALQTGTAMTCISAVLTSLAVIIFSLSFVTDRTWLPQQIHNYLHWGFGMAVVAAFFSVFASIAQCILVTITRNERRTPPVMVPAMVAPSLNVSRDTAI